MSQTVTHALETNRYPQWLHDVIVSTQHQARLVGQHKAWHRFIDGTIPQTQHHALLLGFWPLIERFPQFLALNLLKCSYGMNTGLNKARGWLIKNLRIEQRHAELYRDWAEGAGLEPQRLYEAQRSPAATAIADWCWHVCQSGGLAEAMAATNFSIEGVTGDWTQLVWESPAYHGLFEDSERRKSLRWIQAHAAYDDAHPVEALDIIHALMGDDPPKEEMQKIQAAIHKSYDLYRLALDVGMATD